MTAPFPPTSFDSYAMEHGTLAAIQPSPAGRLATRRTPRG
jgi:hypothetical protein